MSYLFPAFSDEFRKGNATDMRSFIRRYNRDNDGHGVSEETVAKMLDNISKEVCVSRGFRLNL